MGAAKGQGMGRKRGSSLDSCIFDGNLLIWYYTKSKRRDDRRCQDQEDREAREGPAGVDPEAGSEALPDRDLAGCLLYMVGLGAVAAVVVGCLAALL